MNACELAAWNVCQNLDDLCHLDPRGYGVCRILYGAARQLYGEPISLHAAKALLPRLTKGGTTCLLTGFVLAPYNHAETDGITGTLSLARALTRALGMRHVLLCPQEAASGTAAIAGVMGLRCAASMKEFLECKADMLILVCPKDEAGAAALAREVEALKPDACISVEAPGANAVGVYHNAAGRDVSALEARLDTVFSALKRSGTFTLSIGDLGNEIGMGVLEKALCEYIPGAAVGSCPCGCGGGLVAATSADAVVTATVSDWGAYALCGALSWLSGCEDAMPGTELIEEALRLAGKHELIDMYGEAIPAVDGCDLKTNLMIAALMGDMLAQNRTQPKSVQRWFDGVEQLGYFDKLHEGRKASL